MSFLNRLQGILVDPPPEFVFEISGSGIAYVGGSHQGGPPSVADLGGDDLERRFVASNQCHRRTRSAEGSGGRGADPTTGAGDECNATVQPWAGPGAHDAFAPASGEPM